MGDKIGESGYIRVAGEEDRLAIQRIALKNGYTVSTARRKKNGKAYEYFVKYETVDQDIKEEES